MRSTSIDNYIIFGTQLRFLLDAKEGWRIHGDSWVLQNIDNFVANLDAFEMPVSRRAAWELVTFANDNLRALGEDAVLTTALATELQETMYRLRPTIYAESAGNIAFVVTDKRYRVDKLLDDVGSLMAPGVFRRLPDIAQHDYSEAGICIAYLRPTAAAFHLVRACEAVLRQFYRGMVRQRRIAEPWMWGPMVDDMRGRRVRPDQTLLHNLDGMRQNFRNPTQHPDKVYDIDEAQDLFAACIDVTNRIVASARWIDP